MPHVLLALGLGGCAFTKVPLETPHQVHANVHGGGDRQIVLVTPLTDARTDRHRCGMQKNGYNMETADVVCQEDPTVWLARLLRAELVNAGFSVLAEDETHKTSAVRVQGSLVKLFDEVVIGFWMLGFETDIQVKLVASSETGLLAERSVFVKGTTHGQVGRAGNFQNSLQHATEEVVKQIVEDLKALMDRYPDLGFRRPAVDGIRAGVG